MDKKNAMSGLTGIWARFRDKHPGIGQFIVFYLLSNGITLLQLILMPIFKLLLNNTPLIGIGLRFLQAGRNFDGSPYYVFDYAAGPVASGGGGGLAYFLAVQITLVIAQVVNFFVQRNITFRSKGNVRKAAFWFVIASIFILVGAAALQGVYKAPVYNLFIHVWNLGSFGETAADFVTMMINAILTFWVYFLILRVIFKK